jgi:PhoPQ-activated pathogenicity-related protein
MSIALYKSEQEVLCENFSNAPYWTVESLHLYWNDLPSPKMVYQSPNAGHGAGGTPEATQALVAFLQMVADGQKPPQMTWAMKGDHGGEAIVTADQPAKQTRLWTADSATRDFRKAKWNNRPLTLDATHTRVSAKVDTPAGGFTAFMVELAFTTPAGNDFRLSTQVQVTPDAL